MRLFFLAAAGCLLFLFPCAPAQAEPQQAPERPKIGLALSGGGARGGAHVGVLRVLEDLNVPVDYIAGTSMGAIIGSLYAAGFGADRIEELLEETDWLHAMSDQPSRADRTMRKKELEQEFLIPYRIGFNQGEIQLPLGAIEGQHLDQLLHRMLLTVVNIRNFDRLAIPFRAVATDLVTGAEVVLSSGSLADAVRASMSVPGVFAPVRIRDHLLVDGGMSNNLPVSVVREMGADIVIAVDISTPMLSEDQLTSVVDVTSQLTNFLTRRSTEVQIDSLTAQDLLIVPELGDFSSADFEAAVQIVGRGAEAALAQKDRLSMLVDDAAAPPEPVIVHEDNLEEQFIVRFVDIENDSVLHDQIVSSRLDIELGAPLDLDALDRSVDQVYALDVFKSVTYNLVENEEGEQGVRVQAVPRDWGPNYLQFGLELANDYAGTSEFMIGAAYTRNALNRLGGELRVLGSAGREDELRFDFYQPIDIEAHWFVQPEIFWSRRNYNVWDENTKLAELEIGGWGAQFGIGRNFGSSDQLRLQYEFQRADADVTTGQLGILLDDHVDLGELVLQYRHDSLDSPGFPTSGMLHRIGYRYAREGLGAAADYQQAMAWGSVVLSHERNTLLLNYEADYSFDDAAPLERWFRLGGFGRLSGLAPNQLSGRHLALATLAAYRRLNTVEFFPVYAGLTLEAGNVWEFRDEIGADDLRYGGSLFIGAETPLGPVYFSVGHGDDGNSGVYFYLGNPFNASRIQ